MVWYLCLLLWAWFGRTDIQVTVHLPAIGTYYLSVIKGRQMQGKSAFTDTGGTYYSDQALHAIS
jgi:hypothetical protein